MLDFSSFKADLQSLVCINSENRPAVADKPFGEGVYNALTTFLNIANRMGFETFNYDNYIGEVRFGEGEEIGVIGHVDVVPAGIGWDTPPYSLVEKDGALYGRGVSDDKGPLLLSLYALKALKDSGVKVNKTFRLFVGCDEESNWQDVAYFKAHHSFPKYGFSPDGNFPVSYSEKGMAEVSFELASLKNFTNLSGGTVVNAVCAKACAKPLTEVDKSLVEKHGLTVENGELISIGKSAHGSQPQLGVNAIKKLFEFLLDNGEEVENALNTILSSEKHLENLVNEQGKTTLSAGLIEQKNGKIIITCDLRVPAPLTFDNAFAVLDTFGFKYTVKIRHEPVVVSKEGQFVNALISAYNSVMNQNLQPVAMGGSTFARAFEKGCAFGAEFPNESCSIHEPNEFMPIKSAKKCFEIYFQAFKNLIK